MHFVDSPIFILFTGLICTWTLQVAAAPAVNDAKSDSNSNTPAKLIQLAPTEKCSGIALTEGELKRALAPKDSKKRQKLVFVTSTCTVISTPSSSTLQTVAPTTSPSVVVTCKPKVLVQCKCEKPVKKAKCPKKLVVVSHNYTITEHLPCHQTVSHTIYKTIPVFSTLCTTLPVTSSVAVFCTRCVTLTKEAEIEAPETFTLTSTQVAIKRVKECCPTTSSIQTWTSTTSTDCGCCPPATLKPSIVTKTCQVTATAVSTKKVIIKVQKCNVDKEASTSYIPWWLKGLTPNYDQAKAEAYKKQLNEPKSESNSKCLVTKAEKAIEPAQ